MDEIQESIKSQFSNIKDQITKIKGKKSSASAIDGNANIDTLIKDVMNKMNNDGKRTDQQQSSKQKNDPNMLIQQSIKHDLKIAADKNLN